MTGRVRRVLWVSVVMLGVIFALAILSGAHPLATVALALGWLSMPIALYATLRRPRLVFLTLAPSSLVTLGVAAIALGPLSDTVVRAGWWVLLAGLLLGDLLGAWFWYRWLPVPRLLRDATSPGRLALIAVHVLAILGGIAQIAIASVERSSSL